MILLALFWCGWCALHSLLICPGLNRWVRNSGGLVQGGYRLFYVIFSLLSLVPVLWYQFNLEQHIIFSWSGWWRVLQILLLLYAALMFYGGSKVYDGSYFLGIRQWRDYRRGREAKPLPFSSKGMLGYVRHPWYSGSLAFIWAMGLVTDVTFMVRCLLSLYLVIGTLLEEQKLKDQLGEPYRKYCRQVPMLIPWKVQRP